MSFISKEEVLKIAHISRITLAHDEIDAVTEQLGQVLAYAQRVTEIGSRIADPEVAGRINVTRPDRVEVTPSEPILARAPQEESGYFVVPAVLEHE